MGPDRLVQVQQEVVEAGVVPGYNLRQETTPSK